MSLDVLSEDTIHDGPRFKVKRGRFRDAHGEHEREWVDAPDATAIVAYDEESVYLCRQPREAIGRDDILEIPAGIMDVEGESPLETAKRELREEIGMEADLWVHATTYYSSSGFTDERVYVYLATGLSKVAGEEEGIELVSWPLADLDGLIDGNADGKTLVGLLWLRRARLLGGTAARPA